jgi:hypothetical protein
MTGVRTRDEALAVIDRALAQWAADSGGVLTQAVAAAAGALAVAETEAARRAAGVVALEQRLAAMRSDDPGRGTVAAQLARAREALQAARQAVAQLAGILARVTQLQRAHVRNTAACISAARADLARRGVELSAYRAAGGGAGGGGMPGVIAPLGGLSLATASAPAGNAIPQWLAASGMADFSVAEADFTDNPIVGTWGRDGFSRTDYRWAVTTWDQVIRPGLDRGLTRDDFEARDVACGARPERRIANVYDWFLGTDKIVVERRPDGTLNVGNGRHRIEIARELGIPSLPAQVSGL